MEVARLVPPDRCPGPATLQRRGERLRGVRPPRAVIFIPINSNDNNDNENENDNCEDNANNHTNNKPNTYTPARKSSTNFQLYYLLYTLNLLYVQTVLGMGMGMNVTAHLPPLGDAYHATNGAFHLFMHGAALVRDVHIVYLCIVSLACYLGFSCAADGLKHLVIIADRDMTCLRPPYLRRAFPPPNK